MKSCGWATVYRCDGMALLWLHSMLALSIYQCGKEDCSGCVVRLQSACCRDLAMLPDDVVESVGAPYIMRSNNQDSAPEDTCSLSLICENTMIVRLSLLCNWKLAHQGAW